MPPATVGVDIGGTKVSVARFASGELSGNFQEPTERASSAALVDQIVAAVERIREPGDAAVGVGVPSTVDFATGTARASVNVPLADVPLRQVLADRLATPVFVDNDATVAGFAEAHDGQGRLVTQHLVMFTVGTGVGGGLVLNGRVYRGATGAAAEIGHTIIGLDLAGGVPAPRERFPQPGSLEMLAAGTELDRLAQRAARDEAESALGRRLAAGEPVLGPDAVDAAQAGDPVALALLHLLARRLGVGIANAINTFDPEVVAVGGGVSRAGELLLGPARETALQYLLPGVGTQTEIRLARHGVAAGVLGAALMAREELEHQEGSR